MTFIGWLWSDKTGTWHQVCESGYKARVEAQLAALLDELRQPDDFGQVLPAGRTPRATPAGHLPAGRVIREIDRGNDGYTGGKQQ
jgi:hypothetical protein